MMRLLERYVASDTQRRDWFARNTTLSPSVTCTILHSNAIPSRYGQVFLMQLTCPLSHVHVSSVMLVIQRWSLKKYFTQNQTPCCQDLFQQYEVGYRDSDGNTVLPASW